MARLQEFYKEKVVADLMAKFSYKSAMEVPRITKITLNMGLSEAVADKKLSTTQLVIWARLPVRNQL